MLSLLWRGCGHTKYDWVGGKDLEVWVELLDLVSGCQSRKVDKTYVEEMKFVCCTPNAIGEEQDVPLHSLAAVLSASFDNTILYRFNHETSWAGYSKPAPGPLILTYVYIPAQFGECESNEARFV